MRAAFLGAVLIAATIVAGAEPAADPLARLQNWLDGARTLSGRFVQELESGALGGKVVERGRLWVERPGKLRWEYTSPESKTAIVVGEHTQLYLASERQLFEGRLDPEAGLLTALLGGTQRLSTLFGASPDGGTPVPQDRPASDRIRLRPLAGAPAEFEEAVVTVRRSDGALLTADVLDAAGNRMTYRFEGLERNGRIPPGTFTFDPPAGTEIVRQP